MMKTDSQEIVAAWLPTGYGRAEITIPEGNFGTSERLFKIDLTKFVTSK